MQSALLTATEERRNPLGFGVFVIKTKRRLYMGMLGVPESLVAEV